MPGYSEEILKRNLIRCYTTAEAVINQAVKIHRETAFLHYAPHFVYRTLMSASCVIVSVHLSAYTKGFQADTVDALVKDAIRAMRACSVQDGDLHMRGTNMLEQYWNHRYHLARVDMTYLGISTFTHRMGASLTFSCLRRWKENMEQMRDASNPAHADPGGELLRTS
jgi:transcriptional regulatory protein LEU3